jgi:hypothetical protein
MRLPIYIENKGPPIVNPRALIRRSTDAADTFRGVPSALMDQVVQSGVS